MAGWHRKGSAPKREEERAPSETSDRVNGGMASKRFGPYKGRGKSVERSEKIEASTINMRGWNDAMARSLRVSRVSRPMESSESEWRGPGWHRTCSPLREKNEERRVSRVTEWTSGSLDEWSL